MAGTDGDDFAISETGALTFASPPNFESPLGSGLDNNQYLVTVQARDDNLNTSSLDVTVTVTEVNEGPEVTGSVSLTFTENQLTDRVLATYTGTDPEVPFIPITRWSLSGTDAGDFTINENGELSFRKRTRPRAARQTPTATTCTISRCAPRTEASTATWG